MTYTKQTEHYEDLSYKATPTTNCGPSWNTGCYLWAQSYNNYYVSTLDNGEGWHENLTWKEARNNTYGVYVPSGTTVDALNPFSCDGQEANYPFPFTLLMQHRVWDWRPVALNVITHSRIQVAILPLIVVSLRIGMLIQA